MKIFEIMVIMKEMVGNTILFITFNAEILFLYSFSMQRL